MGFKVKNILLLVFILGYFKLKAQVGLPIYFDYLSDNIFLVHPTAAGMSNSAELRLTHRQQWNGNDNSPSLQTISFHNRMSERAAIGGIFFNDKNGFNSQIGIQAAYAYHINYGRDEALDQLSFALAGSFVQNRLDQRTFTTPDPVISQLVESDSYVNFDAGLAYFNLDGYAYFTVKNLILNSRNSTSPKFRSINLRKYLLNIGYFFGWQKRFQFEPSLMALYTERTQELNIDFNTKVYKVLGYNKRVWMALSYRHSFDSKIQNLSQITPIVGVEYKRYLLSYTYTHELGDIIFQNGGFHQFTLGIDVFQKRPKDRGYIPKLNQFMFKTKN